MADIIDAFRARLRRRLGDFLREAHAEVVEINEDMGSKGRFTHHSRIERLSVAMDRHLRDATNWALAEAEGLIGGAKTTREYIRPVLVESLGRLFYDLTDQVNERQLTDAMINYFRTESERMRTSLVGDLDDFESGLWSPRNLIKASAGGTPLGHSITITNSNAVVQQGGVGNTQSATLNVNWQAVREAVDILDNAIDAAKLATNTRDDLRADLDSIKAQLRKPSPGAAVVFEAARSLRSVTEGVVGGGILLEPHVAHAVAALVSLFGLS